MEIIEYIDEDGKSGLPTLGKCECGEEVQLSGFTNPCYGCDRDYDRMGNLLAPREQWGEETGEHWCDIINIDRR